MPGMWGKGGAGRHVKFSVTAAATLDRYLRARRAAGNPADRGPLWVGREGALQYSGLVYTREQFSEEPVGNAAEIAVGSQIDFFTPHNDNFSLTNTVISYYSLSSAGRVRIELQSAWHHEFLKDFYWSLNGVESFDSDPPETQKKNDFSLSVSIGWKF